MSNIYYGPRQQVMLDIKALPNVQVIRYSDKPTLEDQQDFFFRWQTPLNPPRHLVFIGVHNSWDLKDLKPRPDRHIAVLDTKLSANISKWSASKISKGKISLKPALELTKDQLYSLLINGKIGLRFTPKAANLLLDLRPRGLQSLYWPIEQLKDIEVKEPVTIEGLMGQWPTKSESDAYQIYKCLGKKEAIDLAIKVDKKQVWGGLFILTKMCAKRREQLEYLELCKDAILRKSLTPKAALVVFTLLCYQKDDSVLIELLT